MEQAPDKEVQDNSGGQLEATAEQLVQAVLPEDAPVGHEAYTKVRFEAGHKWPLASFTFGSGLDRVRFQTTLNNSGSQDIAERLARACYMKFEQGASVDEVKQFRKECYDRIKEVRDELAGKPKKPARERHRRASALPNGNPATQTIESTTLDGHGEGDSTTGSVVVEGSTAKNAQASATDVAVPEVAALTEAGGLATDDANVAPPAQLKMMFDKANNYHYFMVPGSEPRKKFTVSAKHGMSLDDSFRIARMCYAKFEAGMSVEEVRQIREELVQQCSGSKVDSNKLKRRRSADGETDAMHNGQTNHETKGGDRQALKDAQVPRPKEEPLPPEEAASPGHALQEEDAPLSSAAHEKVKYKRQSNGSDVCFFEIITANGSKERLQTTLRACGGSQEEAMRIARLCYVKFEGGASRAEVEQYRNDLYAKFAAAGNSEKRQKHQVDGERSDKRRRRKANDEASLVEELRAAGRLAGALRIAGRDVSAKNASVNGVYTLVEGGFADTLAYRKVGSGQPRFLFYSSRKSRWKINDELDDAKNGFAYAKTRDGGKAAPSDHGAVLRWHVFDGKAEGYNEDPALQCVALSEGLAVEDAGVTGRSVPVKKAEAEEDGKVQAGQQDEESAASGSPSSSSSSSGSEEVENTQRQAEELMESASVPPSAPASSAAVSMQALHGRKIPYGRVCAKMLVRSGLRCGCHFSYLRDCPNRA
mmetsp:Transcript_57663/g.134309  ORF Transcript_57663/g.134309 Transcript_57663/m.134309 type:complete len:706 (-) Transcript_57663:63-2180(-)